MELILISESKLKIMLSQRDMEKYELSLSDIDSENRACKRAFGKLLEEAKARTGFCATQKNLYIQIFPGRSGGCEIFITKTNTLNGNCKEGLLIFTFSSTDDVIRACKTLLKRGYSGKSSLFYNEDGTYYLLTDTQLHNKLIYTLCEFSKQVKNKKYIYHIFEHSKELCTDTAVETMADL